MARSILTNSWLGPSWISHSESSKPVLNQIVVGAAAILYGALILGADLMLDAGDVIAIAYLGMAFPCLWLTWSPGPILCSAIGAVFVSAGGYFGGEAVVDPVLTLAARGGSIVALLGAGLLAASRIKSDQALHLTVARFTDVLEVSADWIWETDADHRYTFLSKRAYDLTGYEPGDLIGRRRPDLVREGNSGSDVTGHMSDLIARRPFHGFEYWSQTPGGRRCFAISGKPLFDRKGAFMGYRGAGRDVTDQAQIAQKLEQATLEAEAANRAKSEFLSTMSHELRTPLNAVIGFSEVIGEQMFGPAGSPKYVEYANDIQASGRHLLDMINDILDISRIESGHLDLADEPIVLTEVITQAMTIMEERARRANVRIDTMLPANLPRMHGDKRALTQVLLNLLSNAIKFTPDGGSIKIIGGKNATGGVSISVTDTGVGIPSGEIEALMQPFSQASNQTAARESGTGLGLYLVKRLIEEQDGEFTLKSEEGVGACATISVPPQRLMAAA